MGYNARGCEDHSSTDGPFPSELSLFHIRSFQQVRKGKVYKMNTSAPRMPGLPSPMTLAQIVLSVMLGMFSLIVMFSLAVPLFLVAGVELTLNVASSVTIFSLVLGFWTFLAMRWVCAWPTEVYRKASTYDHYCLLIAHILGIITLIWSLSYPNTMGMTDTFSRLFGYALTTIALYATGWVLGWGYRRYQKSQTKQ